MADEIASLVVSVDSTTAQKAVKDLENLAVSGDKAQASSDKLAKTWSSMTMSPAQLYTANRGLAEFRREAQEAAVAAAKVDDSWKKATFTPTQLFTANRALTNFRKELEDSRRVVDDSAKRNVVLSESQHQVARAAAGYTKTAKELAFATRNLPAQFTDIAVSLQAGQNPLTVFLQQGGQLKDMFGSIGGAAKAMGSYVLNVLTNPWILGAAALGSFLVAMNQGQNELEEFNKSVIMTGNSVGTTVDDLQNISASMERFGQTQGTAAAALAQTAAAGNIFGESIQTVAQAALNLEREAGQAISKTVDQFSELAGDPLDASIKLDKSFHYLTASTYDQIRALEEQGDQMGAARLAMDAYADAVNDRTGEVEENLGSLERGWRTVAGAAKAAWDAMLDVGRKETGQEKIQRLSSELETILNPPNAFSYAQLGPKGSKAREQEAQRIRDELIAAANENIKVRVQTDRDMNDRLAAQGEIALKEEVRRYASNAEKRKTEKARIEGEAKAAILALEGSNSTDIVEGTRRIKEAEAQAIAQLDERFKDPKKRKEPKTEAEKFLEAQKREYEGLTKSISEHMAVLTATDEAGKSLNATQKFAAKILDDLEQGHTKLSPAQQATIRADLEEAVAKSKLVDIEKQHLKNLEINEGFMLRQNIEQGRRASQSEREIRNIGMGGSRAELASRTDSIVDKAAEDRLELAERYGTLTEENTADYLAGLEKINEAERKSVEQEELFYARRRAAMGDWRNGARRALDQISDQVLDVAGQTEQGFVNAFGAMEAAVTKFAETGKVEIKDMVKVILAELLKVELRILVSRILTSLFAGAATGGGGGTAPSVGTGPASLGVVMQGGRLTSMSLGGGLGFVGNSAKLFPMADGGRLMAFESGAEAVVPLKRGPGGDLGIANHGGGGGATVVNNVSTTVTVESGGGMASSKTQADSDQAKMLGDAINKRIKDTLVEEQRQGGILWAMQNGRG